MKSEREEGMENAIPRGEVAIGQSVENVESAVSARAPDYLNTKGETLLIPNKVYNVLPKLLKQEVYKFDLKDRDIFFLSMLSFLSGILPNVFSVYGRRKLYTNLFFNLIGYPGTGKGNMVYARQAGELIHQKLKNERTVLSTDEKIPERQGMLFVPGNSSNSALLGTLKNNNGSGIMFETESDTLSNSLKQDWGGFSDVLRKAFHHEVISDNKNSGNGYLELREPKISILISGTPNQVPKLIESIEDGLYSRFIIYFNKSRAEYRSVFGSGFEPDYYETTYAAKMLELYESYNSLANPIEFTFSADQKAKFDEFCKQQTDTVKSHFSVETDGCMFRLFVIIYRVAMILTALRAFENSTIRQEKLVCNDDDFNTALNLFPVFANHTLSVIDLLPKKSSQKLPISESTLLNNLPKGTVFQTNDAIKIATKIGYTERTTKDNLKRLVQKSLLNKIKHGHYLK